MEMEDGNRLMRFKAGQVIASWSKPFLKSLYPNQIGLRCTNCFVPAHQLFEELWPCPVCHISYYCSEACQLEDWAFAHAVECQMSFFRFKKLFTQQYNSVHPLLILRVARTIAHCELHPQRENQLHGMYDGSFRSFADLCPHANDGDLNLDHAARTMATWMGSNSRWNKAEAIRGILGIWKANTSRLQGRDENGVEQGIGGAVYLEASVFNHSCRPNAAIFTNKEMCMEVRCFADIPEGAQPLVSYLVDGTMNRESRQLQLKQKFNLECRCDLCEEEGRKGPATNYFFLESLKASIDFAAEWGRVDRILQLRELGILLYKPLFHPYDDRVTGFAAGVFKAVADQYKNKRIESEDVEVVERLADDVLKRLEISIGKEKDLYRYFEARVSILRHGFTKEKKKVSESVKVESDF